ncbi:hypothetical protein BN903_16 [Halorubrum sp. AJ67]|nr:hypothetical protein BN903_16 [Halorubrum sp. AJ67]
MAGRRQLLAHLVGVDEVPVVREPERAGLKRDRERLRAALVEAAGGRVADVTDAGAARQRFEVPLLERVADEAPLDVAVLLEPVVRDDPRGLLPAVLERVQRVVQRARGLPVFERDADDAALLSRFVAAVVPTGVHVRVGKTAVDKNPRVRGVYLSFSTINMRDYV